MKFAEQNREVFYATDHIKIVSSNELDFLTDKALANGRKRARVCLHENESATLHEMLIVHGRGAYIRPHKHFGKSESIHIIEGLLDLVLFDDQGSITQVVNMGNYASGKPFYQRLDSPVFHTLIIRSERLIFHETTNGPFCRTESVFAPWAPEDVDFDLSLIHISEPTRPY